MRLIFDENYSIASNSKDLVDQYQYLGSGHFFDKGTMRFFASRVTSIDRKVNDKTLYFVTTEKKSFDDYTRVYTLRKATLEIKKLEGDNYAEINIETVERFNSRSPVIKAINKLAN